MPYLLPARIKTFIGATVRNAQRAPSIPRRHAPQQATRLTLRSILTILLAANHPHLLAQGVPSAIPPSTTANALPSAPQPQQPLDLTAVPHATLLPLSTHPDRALLDSDLQTRHGDIYELSGDVLITYRNRLLRADTITYNDNTGDITATGHLRLSGGDNDEYLEASHGTYNLQSATGTFYDVTGSVGMNLAAPSTAVATLPGQAQPPQRTTYQNSNPLLFQGRMVVKTGPTNYVVYGGSVTSCLLPRPDWQLLSRKFTLDDGRARAALSTFTLLGLPVLVLPYVTHPINTEQRQAGLLTPVLGDSSSKGFIIGEELYIPLGRSADATIGSQYYSARGFQESGTFRYRGPANDFFTAHFSALQDRGYYPGGVFTKQGGQDVVASFRRQLTANTRAAGDIEYLSSYIYREAFTESFNQAVSSDITSVGYLMREANGLALSGRVDRYQGLKRVQFGTIPGQQVKIFHAPSLDLTAIDRPLLHLFGDTSLLWTLNASAAGLKRVQPNFVSSGIIERLDLRPELSLPLAFDGWHTMASVAYRETLYSRSRKAPYPAIAAPIELTDPVNRSSVELKLDIRPPVIERDFTVPKNLQWLLGDSVRHTIEPQFTYRNTHGVSNFLSVLRFDDTDLIADTDELQYGVTQHLYFSPHIKPRKPRPGCPATTTSSASSPNAPSVTVPPGWDGAPSQATETSELPDAPSSVLDPSPAATNDANGIPNASAQAPDAPLRTHARRKADPCDPATTPARQQEWFSWRLAQKHFFDPTFGGAVINNRRNLFDSTLSLSGTAYLTEARNISPLISRMRFRSSSHTDVEWDFDLDTGASKFISQNIFLDAHEGPIFGGVSYARLNAPGRFYMESLDTNNNPTLIVSAISNFSQMRLLLGYGNPGKPGLSAAGNAGLDLSHGSVQYGTLQTNYNWNCCGLSIEYRKYELGSVRNENAYRFNFTLANIGTAGNLRRAERLF